jgi:hypothetical protein
MQQDKTHHATHNTELQQNKQQQQQQALHELHQQQQRQHGSASTTDHFAAVIHPGAASSDGRSRTWSGTGPRCHLHIGPMPVTPPVQAKRAAQPACESMNKKVKTDEKEVEEVKLHGIDLALARVLKCPKCSQWRCTATTSLRCASGWAHLLCSSCHLQSRSKGWKCMCDKPWYLCKIHAEICSAPGTRSAAKLQHKGEHNVEAHEDRNAAPPARVSKRRRVLTGTAAQGHAVDVHASIMCGTIMAPAINGEEPQVKRGTKRSASASSAHHEPLPVRVRLKEGSSLARKFPHLVQS